MTPRKKMADPRRNTQVPGIRGLAGSDFGNSVSLSDNGDVLAVGARCNAENGAIDSGRTSVFQFNSVSSFWKQVGQSIDGEAGGDASGYSVSLSGDATVVAVGAPLNDSGGRNDAGHVRVYETNYK